MLFQKVMTYNCAKMRILKMGYHYSNVHPVCTVGHFANILLSRVHVVMSYYITEN